MRTFKEAMKAGKNDGLSLNHQLENFLFTYRTTPQATTQQTPCFLFLGRELRTRFDLLRPSVAERVAAKQASQKDQHDLHAHSRSMSVGQPVMVRNMRAGDNWIPGVIVKQLGPVSFLVDIGEGRVWKRHVDHLKVRELPEPTALEESFEGSVASPGPSSAEPVDTEAGTVPISSAEPDQSVTTPPRSPVSTPVAAPPLTPPNLPTPAPPRRSKRTHNRPDYLWF